MQREKLQDSLSLSLSFLNDITRFEREMRHVVTKKEEVRKKKKRKKKRKKKKKTVNAKNKQECVVPSDKFNSFLRWTERRRERREKEAATRKMKGRY